MNELGGPAFPTKEYIGHDVTHYKTGMTLRDYFAASALQGIMACSETLGNLDDFAKWSYQAADAMLEARINQGEKA